MEGHISKVRKFLHSLKLEFPVKSMEEDYRSLQDENMVKDFKICLEFLIFLNMVMVIMSAASQSWIDVYYTGIPVIILISVYCLRRYFQKYIQAVALIIILSFNISRLFLVEPYFHSLNKGRLFYSGFSMATLQSVMFVRLVRISHKLFAIIMMFVLRFVIVSAYIDSGSFAPVSFVRHFLIDCYLAYTLYSQEVNYRKIYKKFVSKNEELLKFKELLAESLPQSLLVVSWTANSFLFSNRAYQNTFGPSCCESPKNLESENKILKANLESLHVDPTTIRDTAASFLNLDFLKDSRHSLSLSEFLKKFTSKDYLSNKTISLSAYTSHNNDRRLFEVNIKKVKWDSDDAIAVIFNDITYQESLIALKLANINKDKIIATVSHELRTPLNSIMGILEITEKKVKNKKVEKYLSLCKDNAQLLLNLVNSILDFQQISSGKLKLNPTNVDIREIVLGIAQLFYFQCKEKNITLDYDVPTDIPKYIFTDQNRLKQILINLVANAIKFTSKGGVKIEVTLRQEHSDKLQLSVMDSGIGIKKEDQKNLFKMYSKIEDRESVNKHGVGLGLTISNALAIILNDDTENHGIKVESEYGIGSRFFFDISKNLNKPIQMVSIKNEIDLQSKVSTYRSSDRQETVYGLLAQKTNMHEDEKAEEDYLTIVEDNAPSDFNEYFVPTNLQLKLLNYATPKRMDLLNLFIHSTDDFRFNDNWDQKDPLKNSSYSDLPKQLSPAVQLKSGLDILIVDDNPFNLLVAKKLIEGLECKIQTALGGQCAIDLIKKSESEGIKFKIIFMDCQMPIMDGFETTKALRAMMRSGEVREAPIFAWTANNSEEDVKRCYDAGMVGHLPKPATKSDFFKVLSNL